MPYNIYHIFPGLKTSTTYVYINIYVYNNYIYVEISDGNKQQIY